MTRRLFTTLSTILVLSLTFTACTSDEATENAVERAPGSVRVNNCEPETLSPSNAVFDCSTKILLATFSGLVTYDPETNEAQWGNEAGHANAASIESTDNRVWTIRLKEGWTFHNGEPVTAASYINSWNYTALSTNEQYHNYFFSESVANISGYNELQESETGGPTATELNGVREINEYTFEVTLNEPSPAFPTMLGYNAFYPMADEVLASPESYENNPIGNGPYKITAPSQEGQNVIVERYEEYGGTPGLAETVEFVLYDASDLDKAYQDVLTGELDVLDEVPFRQAARLGDDFGTKYNETETSLFNYLVFPVAHEDFADPRVRQALSLGINRNALTDIVFNEQYTPAESFISPVLAGYERGTCESCYFDPEQGKALLAQVEEFDGNITIISREDDEEQIRWIDAVASQWEANLGITVTQQQYPTDEINDIAYSGELPGVFPWGWIMDYPLAINYLGPNYSTDGPNNLGLYSNEQYDVLVAQGATANTLEASIRYWQRAEGILSDDMPVIPMFYGKSQVVYSDRIVGVEVNAYDLLDVSTIELSEAAQ